jgi:hypothetical protein
VNQIAKSYQVKQKQHLNHLLRELLGQSDTAEIPNPSKCDFLYILENLTVLSIASFLNEAKKSPSKTLPFNHNFLGTIRTTIKDIYALRDIEGRTGSDLDENGMPLSGRVDMAEAQQALEGALGHYEGKALKLPEDKRLESDG